MNIAATIKYSLLQVGSWLNRNHGSKILYYHDIFRTTNYKALDADIYMGTPLELFKQHVSVIRQEGYEIVSQITKPENQVAIMLDDGFRGIWECRDYFFSNNILPTIFLPAALVGATERGLLSRDEILELQSNGFRFECHGWSHVPFDSVSPTELDRELIKSKEYLSRFLGKEVAGICMPLGFFTHEILERIKQAGYTEIYSCIPGNITTKPFGLLTRNICQYATPAEVRLILRGGNEILRNRYIKMHCHG